MVALLAHYLVGTSDQMKAVQMAYKMAVYLVYKMAGYLVLTLDQMKAVLMAY